MQNQWYIARDGKQYGPVTDADLAQLVQKRELLESDYLWRQGFDNWLPVAQVPEIRTLNQQIASPHAPQEQQSIQQALQQERQDEAASVAQNNYTPGNEELRQAQPNQNFSPSPEGQSATQQMNHVDDPHARAMVDPAANPASDPASDPVAGQQFQPQHQSQSQAQSQAQAQAQSQAQADPDLTNKSLADASRQYPTLHESEANQFEQRQDVQDLIEDDDEALLKGANTPFDRSNAPLTADQNGLTQNHIEGASAKSGAHSAQLEDPQSSNNQPLGMATRDMSSQFQATPQRSSQKADNEAGHGNMNAGPLRSQHVSNSNPQNSNAHAGMRAEHPLKPKSGVSWPLGIGIGVAALFILVIAATFALPYIVPPETIKQQISAALKEKTGRNITFKGKLSYRFFPSLGIDLNNIIIHNPPAIKGPDFLQLGRLQADLKLLPLLSKRVEIGRIVLHRPEIALIKDNQGRVNYEFKTASLSPSQVKTTLLGLLGVKHLRRVSQNHGTRGVSSAGFKVAQGEVIDTSDIIARTLEKLEREEAEAKAKAEAQSTETKTAPKAKPTVTQDAPSVAQDAKGPTITETELKTGEKGGLNTDIIIGKIEIVNGAVKVIDQKENSETMINAINLSVQAPDLKKDITAKGSLRYLEDRINLAANLSTLGAVLKGDVVDTSLTLNSDRFESKFDGKVRLGDKIEFQGDTDVQTYSLQNLLSWLGVDVPKRGYGGAYIRGKLSGTPDVFQLGDATIKVDNSVLVGAIRLRPTGTRPKIEAQLRTDLLDLSPYMQQQAFIHRKLIDGVSGPRKTAVAAWKSEKIDMSFLNKFDALLQLSAGRLVFQKHQLEKAQMGVKVNAGLLTAQLPKFELYGGTGSLNVSLNGAKPRPVLKGRIGLKQIQIKPLLTNSADFARLSGVGNVDLDIVSSGNTERQLISALNGTGRISLADGAIEGVNIPGMIRNVQSGKLLEPFSKPKEKTDFSDLNASFVIKSGVIENNDFLMKGPLLRMSGKGILNLPTEQIDYGLQPKLVSSLAGQGGNAALAGINIPIRVQGPMANPRFIPDAKALLEGNGEAINNTVKSVKNAVKNLKKKKISSDEMKGLLNGLIDGNQDGGQLLDGILQ